MSNLIKDKLWEALEEAAKLRDMSLVQEATRIIQSMQATDDSPKLSLVPAAEVDPRPVGIGSVLGFEPMGRTEIITYLINQVMPQVRAKVGSNQFKRQQVVDEIEKDTILTEKEKNWIGYCLRQELVELNILEEPEGCFLRFSEQYLNNDLNNKLSVNLTEMAQFFQLNVLPGLLKENQYYPVYTVDDLCAYFIDNCGSYSPTQVKENIDDILSLLEEKHILDIQADQVEIGHSVNSKYVTAEDLKQMLQKAV
jgi:hypothetical protein